MMKLSVITINYNNVAGLKKTLDSVALQSCTDFEYIIVDGASTDGSVDIIQEFEQNLASRLSPLAPHIIWRSEPDTGIYNAMNKGLRLANGEYTLMLNSGDYLVDENVVARILPLLDGTDIIQGNTIENHPNNTIRNRGYGRSNISFLDVMDGCFLHQASFIRLVTLKQHGYYDELYKKGSDTYFYTKAMALGNALFKYVDIDVANFDINGISSMKDPKWVQIDKEEDERWYSEHISNRLMELYHTAPAKIKLYDTLHEVKWIWYLTIAFARIAEWINPMPPKVKKEKI